MTLQTDATTMYSYDHPPSGLSSVVGQLYFEFEDGSGFPSVGWVDRLLSVVGWWIYPMKELFLGHASEARLLFGETALGVIVTRVSAETLRLSFVRDVTVEGCDEVRAEHVSLHSFLENLERVAAELDAELIRKGWPLAAHSADIRRLRLLL